MLRLAAAVLGLASLANAGIALVESAANGQCPSTPDQLHYGFTLIPTSGQCMQDSISNRTFLATCSPDKKTATITFYQSVGFVQCFFAKRLGQVSIPADGSCVSGADALKSIFSQMDTTFTAYADCSSDMAWPKIVPTTGLLVTASQTQDQCANDDFSSNDEPYFLFPLNDTCVNQTNDIDIKDAQGNVDIPSVTCAADGSVSVTFCDVAGAPYSINVPATPCGSNPTGVPFPVHVLPANTPFRYRTICAAPAPYQPGSGELPKNIGGAVIGVLVGVAAAVLIANIWYYCSKSKEQEGANKNYSEM